MIDAPKTCTERGQEGRAGGGGAMGEAAKDWKKQEEGQLRGGAR